MNQSDSQRNLSEETIKNLIEMHYRITRIPEYDKMKRCVCPFSKLFNLNHFYYIKLFSSGHYTTLGTFTKYQEYGLERAKFLQSYPYLRHPNNQKSGVTIENITTNQNFINVTNEIKDIFHFKYTINIKRKGTEEIDIFGFGTKHIDARVEEDLINELSLVNKFINYFLFENKKLIQIACENKVDITPLLGDRFYKNDETIINSFNKTELYKYMGLETGESLTPREREVLQFLTNGYSAKFIANKLYVSVRTIENYIAEIKLKFHCRTKNELINLAKDIFD